MNSNDQDPNICYNLTPLLEDNGFKSVEFVEKIVNLGKLFMFKYKMLSNHSLFFTCIDSHPLRDEFLYLIRLTLNSCKPYILKINELTTEEQYLEFREQYVEHRIESSESVWTSCVGMKPLK